MTLENKALQKVHKQIAIWLFICCITVFMIVVLGGATRLTGSGLSMAKINVFKGVIPPLSEKQWQKVFTDYKQTAEYDISYKNAMKLGGFKSIFWLEYLHRLIARVLAGFVFLIPFLYFLIRYFFVKKLISGKLVLKLLLMFGFGALQAVVGWIMVKSGLDIKTAYFVGNDVHVSPYKLTFHFALAVIIYGYIFLIAMSLLPKGRKALIRVKAKSLKRISLVISSVIFIALISGAFVAGTRAGMVYQTFPLMGESLIPDDLFRLESWHLNFFENQSLVQFDHRMLAYSIFILVFISWILSFRYELSKKVKRLYHSLMAMVVLQITLGVITLLTFVPKAIKTVVIATTHQGGAVILFTIALWISYEMRSRSV